MDPQKKKKRATGFARTQEKFNTLVSQQTSEKITEAEKEPTRQNIDNAVMAIFDEPGLTKEQKEQMSRQIKELFIQRYTFENCPTDYEELKSEAIYLAKLTQASFYLMAQRLAKIRDGKLYKLDGYNDFKAFIDAELPIARRTVYDYISIVECFGVRALAHAKNIKHTRLLPAIPLLNSIDEKNSKEKLINHFFDIAMNGNSQREIKREVSELKGKYGVTKVKSRKDPIKILKKAADALGEISEDEIKELKLIMIKLNHTYNLDLLK